MIAKLCSDIKQHFALSARKTLSMTKKSVVLLVAEALQKAMEREPDLTEKKLGEMARVSPRTVANFLRPLDRQVGTSGKMPSGKLTELEMITRALNLEVSELLGSAARTTSKEPAGIYRLPPKGVPLSDELRARLLALDDANLRKVENMLRIQLDMPPLPAHTKVRTA